MVRRHADWRRPNEDQKDTVGLIPAGGPLLFAEDTIPDALLLEHALGEGHWAILCVFEGSTEFMDLITVETRIVPAPNLVTIRPRAPHRVAPADHVNCRIDFRIDFFREPDAECPIRTPG